MVSWSAVPDLDVAIFVSANVTGVFGALLAKPELDDRQRERVIDEVVRMLSLWMLSQAWPTSARYLVVTSSTAFMCAAAISGRDARARSRAAAVLQDWPWKRGITCWLISS